MASVNIRELVLETLLLINRDGEYSHIALGQVLGKYQYLDKKDRAFLTRTVEGTLERRIEIDRIINQFSSVKINKMKPVIREIIRSGVYQLKYMDSVPASAVCNEAVKLAAKKGFINLKGFVNGLLRNISRNLDHIEYPSKEEEPVQWLSVIYSMPEWIVRKWRKEYGEEKTEQILKAFLTERPTSIRCSCSKITPKELKSRLEEEGVTVKEYGEIPGAFLISGYDYLDALETFREGCFQVQDISSMMVGEWADPKEGDYIIDVCAAPGGKSVHLADKMKGTGTVEARDLTEYKVNLIRDNIERLGLSNVVAVQQDALELNETSLEKADIVIADLPCSGLGVLAKKSDLKYKMTEQMQKELAKLQRDILSVVRRYVKPGGRLIYSTCTIDREENEENAVWFADKFPEFHLVKQQQMLPEQEAGDGFYIAEFERKKADLE
ncbi:16S rRNA (cytosine(967)-C(5))-methyltransferase RsmB [Claveliimonas bilis]|uniref:16S rRNA (cytosine(967)-C(5))-methyltransferase RsmB n=1 Tax=Claveliimonas bilis TaxID=3028070 RepID=UPI00292CCFD9|nr:16S rRNA (cytosine(967)-C(5))-methyltransferase RsmB [Claveliimonas bilis]BDZ80854.1 ribosomal RNA small subunit methyltransferase B [Claveliimonas bilis]